MLVEENEVVQKLWFRRLARKILPDWVKEKINARRSRLRQEKVLSIVRSELGFSIETLYRRQPHNHFSYLCDVHGSDKGEVQETGHPYPWASHTYSDYVSRLFSHCRGQVTKVFECGIGTTDLNLVSNMGSDGSPGASLRVWRDYFPNAQVLGADIDGNILFTEDRINTFQVDQTDRASIASMWHEIGGDVDLMVDDGLHQFYAGKTIFENSIHFLSEYGIYIIEDVQMEDLLKYHRFLSAGEYFFEIVNLHRKGHALQDNSLIVIRKTL